MLIAVLLVALAAPVFAYNDNAKFGQLHKNYKDKGQSVIENIKDYVEANPGTNVGQVIKEVTKPWVETLPNPLPE